MIKRSILLLNLLFISILGFAQTQQESRLPELFSTPYLYSSKAFAFQPTYHVNSTFRKYLVGLQANNNSSIHPTFRPTFSLGTGIYNFYGEIYDKSFQNPFLSRIAYELGVTLPFTHYLNGRFYAMFGSLGAHEVLTARRLNFNSQIRLGGFQFQYTFGNFLSPDRDLTPFILAGIESFEFLSKTDLYNANGIAYNYWSDGSIRDLPEISANINAAKIIQKDYTYESDIRTLNLDGFGKYKEQSFAIPLGVGVSMHLSERWTASLTSTMHFTFTDYIDGITVNSVGDRKGDAKNDHFMSNTVSISFKLYDPSKPESESGSSESVDLFALDKDDEDADGVINDIDKCPNTPAGVSVDASGCPNDDDNDGVPNTKDLELNTPQGAYVNSDGVAMNDSLFQAQYNIYNDSTGEYAMLQFHYPTPDSYSKIVGGSNRKAASTANANNYTVELGTYKKGLSNEVMTQFLAIPDIKTTMLEDSSTLYSVGQFTSLEEAENRKKQLVTQGFSDAKVVNMNTGKPTVPSPQEIAAAKSTQSSTINTSQSNTTNQSGTNGTNSKSNLDKTNSSAISDGQTTFRIQLGAFKKKLNPKVFSSLGEVVEVKTEDGLYKYMAGSFNTFDKAAKFKVDALLKGYEGAFITAYKNGKRIPLDKAGATPVKQETEDLQESGKEYNSIDKSLIVFKVQIGVFRAEPPTDIQAKMNSLSEMGLKREITSQGLNRFVVGEYKDYQSAQALKEEMKIKGFPDAFVVASFNNQYITIAEALELLKN